MPRFSGRLRASGPNLRVTTASGSSGDGLYQTTSITAPVIVYPYTAVSGQHVIAGGAGGVILLPASAGMAAGGLVVVEHRAAGNVTVRRQGTDTLSGNPESSTEIVLRRVGETLGFGWDGSVYALR